MFEDKIGKPIMQIYFNLQYNNNKNNSFKLGQGDDLKNDLLVILKTFDLDLPSAPWEP